MRFIITESARIIGVPNPVVALFRNIGKAEASVYDAKIKELEASLERIRQEVLPREDVQGFRELYQTLGHKKVVPAGERLLSSCEKRGFPRYGNLVDAYNIVALSDVTPIGVHDAASLIDREVTLLFRRAVGTETMVPSFHDKPYSIFRGDLTYGLFENGEYSPFAWLGKKDVDNSAYQLREDSTSMLFTAIGNAKTSEALNRRLCEDAFAMLRMSCPEATMELFTAEVVPDELVMGSKA